MHKPTAVVDHEKCRPKECEKGICLAVLACPTKILNQEGPYEVPFPLGLCRGCAQCVVACPFKAIQML